MASSSFDRTFIADLLCKRRLLFFVRRAWPLVEPTKPFVSNWHIEMLCELLERVTAGDVTRLIVNVPPGPMREDSVVETARGPIPLRDVVVGDQVLTHRGRYRPVTAVHHQGVLPILKITTNSGRVTHAAPSHPYLTPTGWVDASDLSVGDTLAVVNRAEDRPSVQSNMSAEEARLLGYLVGDGSVTHRTVIFANADREVIDDFKACAMACGFKTSERRYGRHWRVCLLGGPVVRAFLGSHGLHGASSYTKRIPSAVMAGSQGVLANFVGAYWTCDGGFDVRSTRSRGSRYRAYGTTVSIGLAHDLVAALGLLGIEARFREKVRTLETIAQPGGRYRSFSIEVQREEMAARLGDLPGLCSRKRSIAARCKRGFHQPLWADSIVSVEHDDPAPCMCLTVEGDGSFTCAGIAVKNTMKSLLISVFWPAWMWMTQPHLRILTAAYAESNTVRDNMKMRDIVESEWYRRLAPETVLREDQNAKLKIQTTKQGWRIATSVGGRALGEHPDYTIIDDPANPKEALSDVQRDEVNNWFDNTISLRGITRNVRQVIVMQRLHETDLSGYLAKRGGWEHVKLPMRFDPKLASHHDIRTEEGQLLWPSLIPEQDVATMETNLGSYNAAGQLQQSPVPPGGVIFERTWFKRYQALPAGVTDWMQSWDCSFKDTDGSDFVSGGVWCRKGANKYLVYRLKDRLTMPNTVKALRKMTKDYPQAIEKLVEDKANGPAVIQTLKDEIEGLIAVEPEGSKMARAQGCAPMVEAGNVWLPDPDHVEGAEWVRGFLDEVCMYPRASHDDDVDMMTQALLRYRKRFGGMSVAATVTAGEEKANLEGLPAAF